MLLLFLNPFLGKISWFETAHVLPLTLEQAGCPHEPSEEDLATYGIQFTHMEDDN